MNRISLKDARRNVGKSIEESAAFIGVHPKHLERMEEGKATVYSHTLVQLSKLYNVSIEHIALRHESSKPIINWSEVIRFLDSQGYDTAPFQLHALNSNGRDK